MRMHTYSFITQNDNASAQDYKYTQKYELKHTRKNS